MKPMTSKRTCKGAREGMCDVYLCAPLFLSFSEFIKGNLSRSDEIWFRQFFFYIFVNERRKEWKAKAIEKRKKSEKKKSGIVRGAVLNKLR